MQWDVLLVKPLPDYQLYVELADGRKGIFDVKPYMDRGVLLELKDIQYFNRVGLTLGAITWPHEQDIDPETLLEELQSLPQ